MIESLSLGGVQCDFMSQEEFLRGCRQRLAGQAFTHIVTLNPEMVMMAQRNPAFAAAVGEATWRIPDGAGLVWARWYIRSQFWSLWPSLLAFPFIQVERIQGVDAVLSLSAVAAQENKRVYLLGGKPQQVERTARLLRSRNPSLAIDWSSDHRFDLAGPESIINDIKEKRPDIIFVAYGAPAQTLWIERHKKQLGSVRLAMGVGGAFAILSEERPRAPRWMRRLNLEWVWRLLLEPSRVKRIWQATIKFPLLIHSQKREKLYTAPND